ncbi:MAG TPA: hypothetical protein VM691_03310, partial [Myxococcales bacterium]|nr:hypothetical protein [Myxococcales bacterium]
MTLQQPFSRKAFFDRADLVGARWWQESLRVSASPISRRRAIQALALLGGSAALLGLVATLASPDDQVDISMDSLELQKREGWDVGDEGAPLRFPGSGDVDAEGNRNWQLSSLATDLAPARPSLAPFYVPTLFQSLESSSGTPLRSEIRPVPPSDAQADYLRGEAILSLFKAVEMPKDTAVVLDLEGPTSVAVAAALAKGFEPVFTFDNWPHPLGVVPSHLTLASAVYYRPVFVQARAARPPDAPPAFVLDRNRLAHYTDDSGQFDNRYVAKLPTAENLRSLGVRHLLYVTPDKKDLGELDDLNDDFVDFAKASIDVKVLPLSDLDAPKAAGPRTAYYYGGHSHTHLWFWNSYGWYTPRAAARLPEPSMRATVPAPPANVSRGAAYRAVQRPTIFPSRTLGAGSGVGKQR